LIECCVSWAKTHRHPEIKEKTVWQVSKEEQPYLLKLPLSTFDGYAERPVQVSPISLVSFATVIVWTAGMPVKRFR